MQIRSLLINYIRPVEITEEKQRQTFLFIFILTFAQIVAYQLWQVLYTNYVVQVVNLNSFENGIVQSVREIPGLLAISLLFFLRYIKEETMAIFAVFLIGLGVTCTGFIPSFSTVLLSTLIMSIGFHYYESINQSITLQVFNTKVAPLVIGRVRSISALGSIFATLFILFTTSFLSFTQLYLLGGIIGVIGACWAFKRKPDLSDLPVQKKNLVFKKKYWLFYMLTLLSGGRRQIFIVFSLLLLVEKFHFTVSMVTTLFLINNTVNWLLNPLIGKIINRYGEAFLLNVQFASTILIFSGYAFLDNGWIVAGLYILDQFTFSFNIAEKTFFQKTGDAEDIAPSMALALSINHISAVTVPTLGGWLWLYNPQYPFFVGICLAISSLFFVQFMKGQLENAKAKK